MAVGYDNGDVYLWDTASEQTTATIAPPAGSQANVSVAFGPGGHPGRRLRQRRRPPLGHHDARRPPSILPAPRSDGTGGVSALAFGPGGTLAVGAVNSDVYLWRVKS